MGVPAASDARNRGRACRTTQQNRRQSRKLLAALLGEIADGNAVDYSAALINYYGSLAAIFHAYGVGYGKPGLVSKPVALRLSQLAKVFTHSLLEDAFEGLVVSSTGALMRYLRASMSRLNRESFRVLFLDGDNRLLADRVMWTGTVDAVQVHPREVLREILQLGATAIILAHNHPSGSALPGDADIATTRKLIQVCAGVEVAIHDHIIVGRDGIYSMRGEGLMSALEQRVYNG